MLCPSCRKHGVRSVLEMNAEFKRKVGDHVYTIYQLRCSTCATGHQYALELVEQWMQRELKATKNQLSRD